MACGAGVCASESHCNQRVKVSLIIPGLVKMRWLSPCHGIALTCQKFFAPVFWRFFSSACLISAWWAIRYVYPQATSNRYGNQRRAYGNLATSGFGDFNLCFS
jgi:hypothetical protein